MDIDPDYFDDTIVSHRIARDLIEEGTVDGEWVEFLPGGDGEHCDGPPGVLFHLGGKRSVSVDEYNKDVLDIRVYGSRYLTAIRAEEYTVIEDFDCRNYREGEVTYPVAKDMVASCIATARRDDPRMFDKTPPRAYGYRPTRGAYNR